MPRPSSKSHYVIRVNLVDLEDRPDLPREVGGIPVETVFAGNIVAQAR